ncbi:MAG: hypothetical protein U1B79_01510, partial [Candidatus Pacearchaeota archaeon]|nr:hypothetical protein [Candidatus Pacearchaeota archaeon]
EERTEASKIFLPSTFESGIYSFVIEVSYEGYSARSQRTIEVQVKEGGITITPIDLGGIKTFIIAFLVLLAIITLALVIYRERKKIKRDIEIGLAYETRLFRRFIRHKTSILTFFLIVIVGLLVYLTRFYEFLALKLSEAILWFKIHPAYITYVYYVILGLIFLILLISVLRSKGIREKFHEWKRKRSVGKFFEKKYSAGVREAEKSSRAMEIPERKTNKAFKNLKKGISGFFSALGHWIKKIYEKIMYIPEKKIPLENKLFSKAPYFSQELRKDTSELTEEARAVGREAISEIKEVGKGVRKIEGRVVSEIGEVGKGAQRAVRGSERGVSGFFSDFSHAIKKSGENIIGFFSRVMEIPEKKVPLKSGLFSKAPYFSQELEKDTSDSVEGIKIIGKEISKAASEIEEIPRELGRKEHLFVLREKRNLREETSIVQRSRKVIDGMYNDVASLLSKAFGRRTRRIVVGDFEKHFNKNNRKIARRHRETLRDIIRLEEVSKKKIVGISHEFEAEIHRTRRKAALLIHDLIDYIENNELISSKKEKKELEQRARTYGKEISFVRRISRKASEKVGRLFRRGGREAGRGVRAVEKETGREIGAVKREIPKEMKEVGHFIAEEKKKIGGLFRRQTEEAGKGAGREIREASKEVKVAGHFVGEGKREIQRETENLVQKSGRIVNQIYDDTAGLLSKAFGKRTRKIVAEDFERHFRKHDEKIARRHEKTIKDIIRLKEAFAKKKIAGISREFGEEVHNTREKAAELIYDLVNHLENSNLISSAKERKRVEKKAKMYEHELSFMKRLPEKIGGFFKRIKSEIPKQKKSEFKNPFSINIGKNVFKTNKNQGFKNPFEMHGKEKRHVRKPW